MVTCYSSFGTHTRTEECGAHTAAFLHRSFWGAAAAEQFPEMLLLKTRPQRPSLCPVPYNSLWMAEQPFLLSSLSVPPAPHPTSEILASVGEAVGLHSANSILLILLSSLLADPGQAPGSRWQGDRDNPTLPSSLLTGSSRPETQN